MSTPAFLGLVQTAMRAAQADFPKPVAAAIANRDKLATAVAAIPTGNHTETMAAVAAALLDGRDPLTDPAVVRMVTARTLGGGSGGALVSGVQSAGDALIVDALGEHVDDVIDSLKCAVDNAGQTLTAAHQILGDLGLDDAAAVARLGPAATAAWMDAKAAEKTIRTIDDAWFAIGGLTGAVSASASKTLRLADLDLQQFEQLSHKADPWTVVRAGITVDWATRTTITERQQRLNQEREQREQRAASAFSDDFQRSHGTGRRAAVH